MGVLLTVAYDGTNYAGWQMQKNARAISEALGEALGGIFAPGFSMTGASRTDAGVHALGQRAHVLGSSPVPIDSLARVLNGRLPRDIRIAAACAVPDSFHPIDDAISKTYQYRISCGDFANPLMRNFIWHTFDNPDIDKIKTAAAHIIGEHDFAAFCAAGSSVKTTVRRVNFLEVEQKANEIILTINGNGFLYNMVRIIAGTLVDTGRGKIATADLPAIIASKDRARAGQTAPPQGLTLMEIFYK